MYNFTGRFLRQNIVSTQAESPSDLYELIKSDGDPPIADLRCWLLLKTDDGPIWVEILLGLPGYFESLKALFDEDIKVEFRLKTQQSPNGSPAIGQGYENEHDGEYGELAGTITESMSSLDMNDGSLISTPKSSAAARNDIDYTSAMNEVDPFTLEIVSDISVPIVLRFVDGEFLCLESESFEQFISQKLAEGTNLIDLELKHVSCRGKTVRSFVLTKNVWIRSILHGSENVSKIFCRYLEWSIEREDQLLKLAENEDLTRRVHFWVSDFLEFPASGNRLTEPQEEGIPPFMTPFYFSKKETKMLGNLRMPNHVVLQEQLMLMLGEKEQAGEICASHDIFPILVVAFEIRKGFQKGQQFKNDKKKWIKRREMNIKKNKT